MLIVAAQCTLNRIKAQLRFAYCALGLQIAFCFCGATFLNLRTTLASEATLILIPGSTGSPQKMTYGIVLVPVVPTVPKTDSHIHRSAGILEKA